MKQYRITSSNIPSDDSNDCYLSPHDPVHELKIAHCMDGLGSEAKLQEYRALPSKLPVSKNLGKIQQDMNIKPGTKEWFQLWFGSDK